MMLRLLVVGCIVSPLAGCKPVDHGEVVGVVSINGQPVSGAIITFSPEEGGRTAVGRTEADGSYKLTYTPGVSGAKLGKQNVEIRTYREPKTDDNDRPIADTGTPERFPPEANEETTLVREVKPGLNTFDFDIAADKDHYPPPKDD